MKRAVLIIGFVLCVGLGQAEAGVGDWFKNSWEYATAPVSCIVELGRDLLTAGSRFVVCFLNNANRNPATLSPLITLP